MKQTIDLPGVVWTVLLVGLPMLSVWLEQFFGAFAWAPPVAGLLLIVAKIAQVYGKEPDAPPAMAAYSLPTGTPEPGADRKVRRVLWG